jgi:hypothetical protein
MRAAVHLGLGVGHPRNQDLSAVEEGGGYIWGGGGWCDNYFRDRRLRNLSLERKRAIGIRDTGI